MAMSSLPPGMTIEFARLMKLLWIIESRYGKSIPCGLRKRMTTIDSSGVGIHRATKGFDVSTVGTRWKLMSVWLNCGTDVIDVVRHAAQDRVSDRLGRVAARRFVAVQLLNPLEIDDRDDSDLEVDVLRDIDGVGTTAPCRPS